MDYSRALISTDLQSINFDSCVCWSGLLRFNWPRNCLGSRWLDGVVLSNGSASCSRLPLSICKMCSLIVRTLAPLVYGFVTLHNPLLEEVGLSLTNSQLDLFTLICLQGWVCILYLRSLLCLVIQLVYLNTSTLELWPRFCLLSYYCCPVSCLYFPVPYTQPLKWIPLSCLISNYCCTGSCLSSSVFYAQALSLTWSVCVGRNLLFYPSFSSLCTRSCTIFRDQPNCLVTVFRWLMLPPFLRDMTISYLLKLFIHFSGKGVEFYLNLVIFSWLLSLCLVLQYD